MSTDCPGCGAPHEPDRTNCSYCGRAHGREHIPSAVQRYGLGFTDYRTQFSLVGTGANNDINTGGWAWRVWRSMTESSGPR